MSAIAETRAWRARLELRFEPSHGRTVLVHRAHQGPLLIQRLFHPEEPGGACHAYIIHPPGGVVSGDDLALEATVRSGGRVLLTTPAAGKFYRKGIASGSRLRQHLHVEAGCLEWLPQENIFYPDAVASVGTTVHLAGDARFIGWEMTCLGLPAIGASLGSGRVHSLVELWRDGRPLLIERLTLGGNDLERRHGLAGHPALGTLIASPAGEAELERVRDGRADCVEQTIACTLIDGVLACRTIARDTRAVRSLFERLWRVLRPAVIGRTAVEPRIWAT
jgi:urease accessory protein